MLLRLVHTQGPNFMAMKISAKATEGGRLCRTIRFAPSCGV